MCTIFYTKLTLNTEGKCFWTIQVILNIGPCLFFTDFIDIQSGEVSIG